MEKVSIALGERVTWKKNYSMYGKVDNTKRLTPIPSNR